MSFTPNQTRVLSENSSTTPLNAAATFTGTGVDVSSFASVVLSVLTDQAGVMYADFSPDGTNWDSTLTYAVAAGVNETRRLTVTCRFFRVRVTNSSASNQTYLRLQCLAGVQSGLSAPANLAIWQDSDATTVRPTDPDLEVARGLRVGISAAIKFGRSLAATTGTDVWAVGTSFVEPATAAAITIVSSNANDTAAGTGARTVFVEYIDSNYNSVTVTVTMNGTTPVAVGTGRHVNRGYVVTAGSNAAAVTTYPRLTCREQCRGRREPDHIKRRRRYSHPGANIGDVQPNHEQHLHGSSRVFVVHETPGHGHTVQQLQRHR